MFLGFSGRLRIPCRQLLAPALARYSVILRGYDEISLNVTKAFHHRPYPTPLFSILGCLKSQLQAV